MSDMRFLIFLHWNWMD